MGKRILWGSEMFCCNPWGRRITPQDLCTRFDRGDFSFSFFFFLFPVPFLLFFPFKSLAHQRFRLNFHTAEPPQVMFKVLQSPEFTTPSLPPRGPTAPVPVHPPVDALHSLENAPHTVLNFPLTLKIEGVKTQSFFDTFKVFPIGVASGAQAKSPSASQDAAGRASEGL
jgi:hypothetical protein